MPSLSSRFVGFGRALELKVQYFAAAAHHGRAGYVRKHRTAPVQYQRIWHWGVVVPQLQAWAPLFSHTCSDRTKRSRQANFCFATPKNHLAPEMGLGQTQLA